MGAEFLLYLLNRPGNTLLSLPGKVKGCSNVGLKSLPRQWGHLFGFAFLGTQV
jgi:hypothetical protein